jgi:signal peptidase I
MRRFGKILGAALSVAAGVATAPIAVRLMRSWPHRVAVEGHSMEPELRSRDWLLVDPDAFRARGARLGELVVARDPRDATRLIVKRVTAVNRLGDILVAGDHPAHRGEALDIGRLTSGDLIGRPWFRYWPLARVGRIE